METRPTASFGRIIRNGTSSAVRTSARFLKRWHDPSDSGGPTKCFANITATATDTSGNTSEFSAPVVTSIETTTSEQLPKKYALHQNYPNPFNASTIIDFELPRDSFVNIKIFNIKGEDITTLIKEKRNAGLHHVKFNTTDLSSGVYFIKFITNEFIETKKCTIIK